MVQGLELFQEFVLKLFGKQTLQVSKQVILRLFDTTLTGDFIFKKLADEIETIIGNTEMHTLYAREAAGRR